MKRIGKSTLCLILALALCLALFPGMANAERTVVKSGKFGGHITYIAYSDGELVISGNGPISGGLIYDGGTLPVDEEKDELLPITKVTIQTGVTGIGYSCFSDCSYLRSVTIPSSVTSIGGEAFIFCSSLESVTIPEGVTSIGYSAFEGCRGLTSVKLSGSVNSIGENAFNGCSALKDVYYNGRYSSFMQIGRDACLGSATLHAIPDAPSLWVSLNSEGKPIIKWDTLEGVSLQYQVYRSTTGEEGSFKLQATVTGTSWTDSGASAGKQYWYKVRGVSDMGGGEFAQLSITVRPDAPTLTGELTAKGRPKLSWTAVTGAAKYELWRKPTSGGSYGLVKTLTGRSCTDSSADYAVKYTYKVRAIAADGTEGKFSAVKKLKTKPEIPTPTASKNDQGKPVLTWNA